MFLSEDYSSVRTEYPSTPVALAHVSRQIDPEELTDAQGVADILKLSHRNSVSLYQHRYGDMPRPIVDLGAGRVKLWLRSEVERWWAEQASKGRTRPARRVVH
jgi:glutathione-regulated potassium-efflux system ancillary protein KefG